MGYIHMHGMIHLRIHWIYVCINIERHGMLMYKRIDQIIYFSTKNVLMRNIRFISLMMQNNSPIPIIDLWNIFACFYQFSIE